MVLPSGVVEGFVNERPALAFLGAIGARREGLEAMIDRTVPSRQISTSRAAGEAALLTALLAALLAVLLSAHVSAPVAAAEPTARACPYPAVVRGAYRNPSFGFGFTIPERLSGAWNSGPCVFDTDVSECVCMADHGRTMSLGDDGHITVYAGGSARFELPMALLEDIETFRDGRPLSDVSIESLVPTTLGGHAGFRYVASKDVAGTTRYREAVVAHSADDAVEYSVAIEAPEEVYRTWRADFVSVLDTWHTLRPEETVGAPDVAPRWVRPPPSPPAADGRGEAP